jgi:small subunit ribosomal protein S2
MLSFMTSTENLLENEVVSKDLEALFKVGAHYAYGKSRRHASAKPFIFGTKNRTEIFDLEKTNQSLEVALEFVRTLASEGKAILLASSKPEAKEAIIAAGQSLGLPFVASRWIGGTFTNTIEIKKRVAVLVDLTEKKAKGELVKYTKKERLLIDRKIAKLEKMYSGLLEMKGMPSALFVIDSKEESIAVTEAIQMGIPVISLSNSDCDLKVLDYAIPANDSAKASIAYFVDKIKDAYQEGTKLRAVKEVV